MEIALLAVGRLRPYYREACDEYLQRLRRHARVAEYEVREAARAPGIERQREQEAESLLAHRPPHSILIGLAREGSAWSSTDLARRVDEWQVAARPIAFAIGGSNGLGAAVLSASAATWSLGPLTLPHQLARVVVLEQLYRAFTILRGEPYHKGR